MAQRVTTAYGPGMVVDSDTVRGKTSYKVEGKGFSMWLEAAQIPEFGQLGWDYDPSRVDEDNSTVLPYNPQPQFLPHSGESTIQPNQHLDPEKRLSPADSRSFSPADSRPDMSHLFATRTAAGHFDVEIEENITFGGQKEYFVYCDGSLVFETRRSGVTALSTAEMIAEKYRNASDYSELDGAVYVATKTATDENGTAETWQDMSHLFAPHTAGVSVAPESDPSRGSWRATVTDCACGRNHVEWGRTKAEAEEMASETESAHRITFASRNLWMDSSHHREAISFHGLPPLNSGDTVQYVDNGHITQDYGVIVEYPATNAEGTGVSRNFAVVQWDNGSDEIVDIDNLLTASTHTADTYTDLAYTPTSTDEEFPGGTNVPDDHSIEDIQARLGSKYVQIPTHVDHFSLQARLDNDPAGVVNEVRMANFEQRGDLDPRMGQLWDLEHSDSNLRTAAWADVRKKATRLRRDGQVQMEAANPTAIVATVTGDHGIYQVAVLRSSALVGSSAVSEWTCSCPWGDWAFERQHTFVGRLCSHAYAALQELRSLTMRKEKPRDWSHSASRTVTAGDDLVGKQIQTEDGDVLTVSRYDADADAVYCTNDQGNEDDYGYGGAELGPYHKGEYRLAARKTAGLSWNYDPTADAEIARLGSEEFPIIGSVDDHGWNVWTPEDDFWGDATGAEGRAAAESKMNEIASQLNGVHATNTATRHPRLDGELSTQPGTNDTEMHHIPVSHERRRTDVQTGTPYSIAAMREAGWTENQIEAFLSDAGAGVQRDSIGSSDVAVLHEQHLQDINEDTGNPASPHGGDIRAARGVHARALRWEFHEYSTKPSRWNKDLGVFGYELYYFLVGNDPVSIEGNDGDWVLRKNGDSDRQYSDLSDAIVDAESTYLTSALREADLPENGLAADGTDAPNLIDVEDEDDIVAAFQRSAGAAALQGNSTDAGSGGGMDFAAAARAFLETGVEPGGMQRTAGRQFTLAEQQALMDEDAVGGPISQADLDLRGTHYPH